MKIKICGLSRPEDIECANMIKPDYIGFVFAKSRRQVDEVKALELKKMLSPDIKAVGVFVNADMDFIIKLVNNNIIDIIQLHGDEDKNYISSLKKLVKNPIIKAVSVKTADDVPVEFDTDFILLDNGKGGTGEKFDWNLINPDIKQKMFLAGGISLDNIQEAVKIQPYCIDVSSGAETNGLKDKNKMIRLVRAVREMEEISNV